MKRTLLRGILVCSFLVLVSAVSLAQTDQIVPGDPIVISATLLPQQMIDGYVSPSEMIDQSSATMGPLAFTADEPADSCSDATPLIISLTHPADGSTADISTATEENSDPILSCMWGDPTRKRGYRTLWYLMIAPVSGRITLDTFGSNYDTVLGVFSGECGKLVPVQCNDDSNGFTSETTVSVSEGGIYYVEVADWQPGLVPQGELQFSAVLQPVDSYWEPVTGKPTTPAITRHATATQGDNIYVIGGQSGGEGVPNISNQLLRFNTSSETWTTLQPIPGVGYSNTTAALLNNKIYLPSGYNGNNLNYDGLHWSYNIANNSWSTAARIPRNLLPYGVYFGWAAAAVPPTQNRYFLTGGLSSMVPQAADALVNDSTFVYLPDVNTWLKLDPMQAGRYAHTAVWLEANNLGVCVAGGLGVQVDETTGVRQAVLHRSAECYVPGGSWKYIGDLKIPRFGAGSVVGPDGKWYVFGGLTPIGNRLIAVPQTEVYDPIRGTWSILGPEYNLGNFLTLPPRAFAAGGVVGNELYVIGGSIFAEGEQAIPLIEQLYIPSQETFLPVAIGNFDDYLRPDDNIAEARPLAFGVPQVRDFDRQLDFSDFYYFDLNENRQVTINLTVPENNDFDLALFGQNKLLWGSSNSPFNGEDEQISLFLAPRRYFIRVLRAFPTGQPDKGASYTIVIN